MGQKRPLDKIIIIDNHSTDGTRDYIFKEIDKSYYDKIDYVYLDETLVVQEVFHSVLNMLMRKGMTSFG